MRLTLVLSVLAAGIGLSASAMAEPYPANVRDSFMNECKATATEAHCGCVLGKLEAGVPLNDMLQGQVAETKVDEFVNACLAETTVEKGAWPANLKLAFVDGCKQDLEAEVCTCLATKVEAEMDFKDVMSGSAPADVIATYVEACRNPKADQDAPAPAEGGADPAPAEGGEAPAPAGE